jgi:hypothetical protein
MAAEDYAGKVLGRPIEIIAADMLNKPDVAAAIASRWFDVEGVDAITDVPVTSVALAVQNVAFDHSHHLPARRVRLPPCCLDAFRRSAGLPRMHKQ